MMVLWRNHCWGLLFQISQEFSFQLAMSIAYTDKCLGNHSGHLSISTSTLSSLLSVLDVTSSSSGSYFSRCWCSVAATPDNLLSPSQLIGEKLGTPPHTSAWCVQGVEAVWLSQSTWGQTAMLRRVQWQSAPGRWGVPGKRRKPHRQGQHYGQPD